MIDQQAVQTREETVLHHRERLNAVLLHIQENIDAALTVETLADIAGFSPFYFHRIFAAYLRETTSDYVRRIRLDWAARRLILSNDLVTQIALEAGYETAINLHGLPDWVPGRRRPSAPHGPPRPCRSPRCGSRFR